jgi:hypothetical protein
MNKRAQKYADLLTPLLEDPQALSVLYVALARHTSGITRRQRTANDLLSAVDELLDEHGRRIRAKQDALEAKAQQ